MDGRNIEDEESTPLVAHDNTSRDHGIVPQLLTSVPTLNEAASYLSETTSYLTSCFPDIPAEQMSGKLNVQDTETLSPANCAYQAINGTSSSDSGPAVYASSSMAYSAPPIQDGISRGVAGESSEQVALVKLGNSNQNGRVAGESSEQVALVKSGNSSQNGTPLFQGLIERVRKTVRGSADDIGWLQRASDMPPVEDGTERFDEILDEIRHGVHRLPSSMVYLLVPGLFSNHGPLYFVNTKTSFSKMGLTCHIAKIHSEASVEKNAREIKEYIEELYWGSNKRVMLLGHSKGGVDAAAALSMYWSDLKDKVAGLAFAQSPFGGSPIASDILREGQLGDYVNMRKLTELLICKVIKGDMQALEDLTYEKRKEFLKKYSLPSELPLVSFHTEASISPAVLATLSRVAHADLPLFTPLAAGQSATLPVVMPLGAVMAACAQLLQMRYGEKSDGLVTCRDAEVPGSVVVRPKRKLDHAWMVYSSLNDDPLEVNATMVCEALLYLLIEAGHKKKHEFEKKDE